MKSFLVYIVCFLVYLPISSAQNFDFQRSLRIDFQFSGTENQTDVFWTQQKEEPHYGGPTTNLIMPDYGDFRLQLIEPETQKVLFSKGFNSLYNEWKHTDSFSKGKKLFYHAIQVPYLLTEMVVRIDERNRKGTFETIFEREISPDDYFIKTEKTISYPVKNIQINGKPNQKVDVAIVAEGYTANNLEKFYADAQRMINYLFSLPPYNKLQNSFNVYAIGSTSLESGTDIPGENIYRNTIFDSSFYTFDMERYLTTNNIKAIADVASLVPYDQIYVLVNTSQYGGGAFYNHLNLTSVDHELSEEVFAHEFGHGFVGLADEYYESSTAFDSIYTQNVEPWEPNITTLVDFKSKWKTMVLPKTPIPTPRSEIFAGHTGAFEGGGYVAKGVYSPVQNCRMKTNTAKGFCPVCSKAIENAVKWYSNQ